MWGDPGRVEDLGSEAAGVHLYDILLKRRSLQCYIALGNGVRQSQAIVREKEKELVFYDRPTKATAKVAILLVVARGTVTRNDRKRTPFTDERRKRPGGWAIELVEGVQALVIEFDEAAAVIVVRTAFGDDLHLCTGVAPLLGIK